MSAPIDRSSTCISTTDPVPSPSSESGESLGTSASLHDKRPSDEPSIASVTVDSGLETASAGKGEASDGESTTVEQTYHAFSLHPSDVSTLSDEEAVNGSPSAAPVTHFVHSEPVTASAETGEAVNGESTTIEQYTRTGHAFSPPPSDTSTFSDEEAINGSPSTATVAHLPVVEEPATELLSTLKNEGSNQQAGDSSIASQDQTASQTTPEGASTSISTTIDDSGPASSPSVSLHDTQPTDGPSIPSATTNSEPVTTSAEKEVLDGESTTIEQSTPTGHAFSPPPSDPPTLSDEEAALGSDTSCTVVAPSPAPETPNPDDTREITRRWPRAHDGETIEAEDYTGITAPNGILIWGATVRDFYKVRTSPDDDEEELMSGSILAKMAEQLSEEGFAPEEMERAREEAKEGPKRMEVDFLSEILIQQEENIRMGLEGQSWQKEDEKDDEVPPEEKDEVRR